MPREDRPIEAVVVVPTLGADDSWRECLAALRQQTFRNFEVIVVDNSGTGAVRMDAAPMGDCLEAVIYNARNVGFGEAINQGIRQSHAPFIAALNDDAKASPQWLAKLMEAATSFPGAGMFASEVRLAGGKDLDSAGMLIALDGSSKQRGHGQSATTYAKPSNALFPSGSAALYRRTMLEETGLFDEDFFLYCEDTDLGLRGRWAGWDCRYVAGAAVEHSYSKSAGRASALKAYYVERNRLMVLVKNYPWKLVARALFAAPVRYFWHVVAMLLGQGKAAEFRDGGGSPLMLPWLVMRAHLSILAKLPSLLKKRSHIQAGRRISSEQFEALLAQHRIGLREVATL